MKYKNFLNVFFVIFIFLLSVLLLEACVHDGDDTSMGVEIMRSEFSRNLSPDIEKNELNELVAGNNSFALDLYHAIRIQNGNLFYSPYSISLALAMTYAGARNETEQQMRNTLHFTISQERLHANINALDLELASRGEGAKGQDGEGFRLNICNSLWGQKGYSFLNSFLDILALNYGEGLKLVDFQKGAEDSRIVINDWVSDQTESKIKDLIPQGVITSLTRLVLVNAIYFNAAWSYPFQEESTEDDIFYLLDGSEVTVPMMSEEKNFAYTEGTDYQAIELKYDGEELSMVIILPQSGLFSEFESSMSLVQLEMILDNLELKDVELKMPKFSYEPDALRLKDTLSQMGMSIVFSNSADFSGIDGTNSLAIIDVLHKALISVNEAGTEAAAATAAVVGAPSVPLTLIKLSIDRPFIFFIRDINTNTILFIGRILNPAG